MLWFLLNALARGTVVTAIVLLAGQWLAIKTVDLWHLRERSVALLLAAMAITLCVVGMPGGLWVLDGIFPYRP